MHRVCLWALQGLRNSCTKSWEWERWLVPEALRFPLVWTSREHLLPSTHLVEPVFHQWVLNRLLGPQVDAICIVYRQNLDGRIRVCTQQSWNQKSTFLWVCHLVVASKNQHAWKLAEGLVGICHMTFLCSLWIYILLISYIAQSTVTECLQVFQVEVHLQMRTALFDCYSSPADFKRAWIQWLLTLYVRKMEVHITLQKQKIHFLLSVVNLKHSKRQGQL